ncbi:MULTISPECIES: hypothetical protein [Cyanophyceae]|uniref:hypothetical protein n=1 Tax=Cyanophyceae TaxID=3028117 RepID=UPI001683BEE1|nr:hypothetical protein [Trichocoleus sp. FACHB-40]MBD2005629.1 hypothetical protein [Trichocoleus sp. FACHB-40]
MALEFLFDAKTQRYRYKDSGKFVGDTAVRNLTQKAIGQIGADLGTIGDLLVQGKISVATWEKQTALALKNLHTWNYMLGVGGQKNMTASDYGILGNQLKTQYEYLRGFANDLRTTGMTQAQFQARLQLYANAGHGTYERARLKAHTNAKFNWERRIRTKANSCPPCIGYEARGWQPIGTLPNPMQDCDCRSRCGCYKRFSKSKTKPQDSLLSRNYGWVGSLKQPLKMA